MRAVVVVAAIASLPSLAAAEDAEAKYASCIKQWNELSGDATALLTLVADPASTTFVAGDHAKADERFAKIEALCAGECKGVAPPAGIPAFRLDDVQKPELWCKAAADRKALLKRSVVNGMKSWKGMHDTVDVEKIRAEYTQKEGYWSELTAEPQDLAVRRAAKRARYAKEGYAKKWKDVGMTDAEIDAVVDSTMEFEVARWKILEELATTFTFPKKGNKDGKLESMAKAAVTKSIKGAKVLATVMNEKAYKVSRNALGVPVERWKDGSILFQVPGEKLCRQEGFSYTEGYDGRKYVPSPSVRLNLWRYIDCKNIK